MPIISTVLLLALPGFLVQVGAPDASDASRAELAVPLENEAPLCPLLQPGGRPVLDWLVCGELPVGGRAEEGEAQVAAPPLDPAVTPVEGSAVPRPDGSTARWFRLWGGALAGPGVDLARFLSVARPTRGVAAYAATSFEARAGEALLLAGADGPLSIWLNGELVHAGSPRRLAPDSEVVRVRLAEGLNRVLLRVESGAEGPWRFSLRVANERQAFPTPADGEDFLLYGQPAQSRGREDVLIRHFFAGRREGVFVDVGAAHHRKENNTFVLEKDYGWTGLALDALEEFGPGYAQHRPGTTFVSCLVGEQDEGVGEFFRAPTTVVSSTDREWAESEAGEVEATEVSVPLRTLTSLLDEHGLERVDLLSMDIELAEPGALAGFDIDRFRPQLVCIEASDRVAGQIAAYFRAHGYERIHDYLQFDAVNWYFTPGR